MKPLILIATFALLAPRAAAQLCEQLEVITAGGQATGVSADGRVIVGRVPFTSAIGHEAYRWTAAGGLQILASPGAAAGVSNDGSTVVGVSGDLFLGNQRAFRWTAANGLVDLGTLGGAQAYASDVSADGTTVVGSSRDAAFRLRAYRWTAPSGMQSLGTFAPSGNSVSLNVSADGSVVVGRSAYGPTGSPTAFRWTAAMGMEDLGDLYGASTYPYDVSADGETLIGWSLSSLGAIGSFRWHRDTGFVDLDALHDGVFVARACTPDANVLVGDGSLGSASGSSRLRLCWVGEGYCGPSASNSSIRSAYVRAAGSDAAADNRLEVTAYALSTHSLGYFLTSRQEGYAFPVSNSQGALCLAGAVGRFVGPGQVLNSGSGGSFTLALDLTALPTPTGAAAAQPGETWHFQAWHRDSNPAPTSNFTSAVRVNMR